MPDVQDLNELKQELIQGTRRAVQETWTPTNRNATIDAINTGLLCTLCVNMIKYNTVPLATFATCTACGLKISSPIVKSFRAFLNDPTKGF